MAEGGRVGEEAGAAAAAWGPEEARGEEAAGAGPAAGKAAAVAMAEACWTVRISGSPRTSACRNSLTFGEKPMGEGGGARVEHARRGAGAIASVCQFLLWFVPPSTAGTKQAAWRRFIFSNDQRPSMAIDASDTAVVAWNLWQLWAGCLPSGRASGRRNRPAARRCWGRCRPGRCT